MNYSAEEKTNNMEAVTKEDSSGSGGGGGEDKDEEMEMEVIVKK